MEWNVRDIYAPLSNAHVLKLKTNEYALARAHASTKHAHNLTDTDSIRQIVIIAIEPEANQTENTQGPMKKCHLLSLRSEDEQKAS